MCEVASNMSLFKNLADADGPVSGASLAQAANADHVRPGLPERQRLFGHDD